MKVSKLTRAIEIIYGLILLIFGLNAFFMFMPGDVSAFSEKAANFMTALFETGYMVPLLGVIFVLIGLSYILNKYVSLGNIMLFPVMVNILLFHIFLDFNGWWIALILVALNIYMIKVYWKSYERIFDS